MDVGLWTGMNQATGQLANTGMKLMDYQARREDVAAQQKLEQDRLAIEKKNAEDLSALRDVQTQKEKIALDEAKKQQEQLNQPIYKESFPVLFPGLADNPNTSEKLMAELPWKKDATGREYITQRDRQFFHDRVKADADLGYNMATGRVADLGLKHSALVNQFTELASKPPDPGDVEKTQKWQAQLDQIKQQVATVDAQYHDATQVLNNLDPKVREARASKENQGAYQVGHVQSFDIGEGKTVYREYMGNGQWKERPDLGGKSETAKGFDTPEAAFSEAQNMLKLAGPDAGVVASVDMGPGNKYIPKLLPNITLRIPPMTANANLPPNVFMDRRTGKLSEYVPETNTTRPYNPEGGIQQASTDWQAIKKAVQTTNSPTFRRLVNNAEILAKGTVDPKTGKTSTPEIDQIIQLRNDIPDKLFSKVSNDLQAFNKWDQWLAYKTSDPKMARLLSKVMAATDTLGSIYAGGGTVTSDFKMKFAKDLFETALSKEAFKAKMETHKESIIDRINKFSTVAPQMFHDIPQQGTQTGATLPPGMKAGW